MRNVLFIITDQQRADHVGFAGNEVVRTPHLDALAARGTVFDNAWVANPVCMPNRSTIMTGRMPTAHGVVFNDRSLDWGANTHVRQFRDAGYRTALIGKSHLQHGMSRNSVITVDKQPAIDDPYPEGWDTFEHFEAYTDEIPEPMGSFYGFDHVELSIDHGARLTGHHLHWALEKGGKLEDLLVPMTAESPAKRRHPDWWQIYEPPYDPELHSTSFVADRTCAFIEDAAAAGEPWLAWASFPDPHHPMTPPGEWFDRHDPAEMELPLSIDDPMETAPAHLRRIVGHHLGQQRGWVTPCGVGGDHDLVRHAIAATYGSIEMIDDRVGQIMSTIERLGQLDDTLVVFTADHGDMMGEHGLMLKGFMHYRGTLQVPMVIVDPTRPGQRTSALAGSIDLGPTLLELAGMPDYDGIQGTSLVPVLDDPTASARDHILVEDDMPHAAAAVTHLPAKTRTIIADGMKYTRNSLGEDQLFDLEADFHEMEDLAPSDATRRMAMVDRLAASLIDHADDSRGTPVAV